MARAGFARCLEITLRHEGGYADHPSDPGGATNFGITRATLAAWLDRPVSKEEVRALSRADVTAIYRALYWNAIAGDVLPAGVDLAVFDHAVNSGPDRALRALAEACGGAKGNARALAALAGRADSAALIRTICARRRDFLRRLRIFPVFGRGWLSRVAAVEQAALTMIDVPSPSQHKENHALEHGKSFLESRTVWSNFIGLAALSASILGFNLAGIDQSALVDAALKAVAGLSFVASTLFRVAATKRLT